MQQSGEHRIEAPIDQVWRALNDPEVLARCIDGCESLERIADNAFKAKVRAKVGPVSALFSGDITMTDIDPPHAYTLQASAQGGAAGVGKGVAKVRLSQDGAATVLSYDVEGNVGGKLAQVGQRLIDGAARKMADDFFAAFSAQVSEANPDAPAAAPAPQGGRPGWPLWAGVGLGAAIIVAIILLGR
jgi:carbon monoxide dehydrogenase subunit G